MEGLRDPKTVFVATDIAGAKEEFDPLASVTAAEALPVPSSWLPQDVDESIPPVESGASCALDDIVQNAGKRLQELVASVDRFTATEMVSQQSLNKWGAPSSPAKAQFDYIVTMEETRRGALSVEEYRQRRAASQDFSEEVITSGLPALVVIFHPFYSGNYDLRCEGLARWNGGLAWQVHFRQRADKPNAVRSYKLGLEGPSYPVALKGRAWIAADTYQIVRLETNLVAPLPQIRLAAEHVNIEYAPVHFRQTAADMWLPANVEIYYDWRGRRVHRQHRFTNYLLFSVEDKQHISDPRLPPSGDAQTKKPPR